MDPIASASALAILGCVVVAPLNSRYTLSIPASTRPINNFRWNYSPLLMLCRLEEIGRAERVAAGQVMPAVRVRDFNFANRSEAV